MKRLAVLALLGPILWVPGAEAKTVVLHPNLVASYVSPVFPARFQSDADVWVNGHPLALSEHRSACRGYIYGRGIALAGNDCPHGHWARLRLRIVSVHRVRVKIRWHLIPR